MCACVHICQALMYRMSHKIMLIERGVSGVVDGFSKAFLFRSLTVIRILLVTGPNL